MSLSQELAYASDQASVCTRNTHTSGGAGFWENMKSSPGSISYELGAVLHEAFGSDAPVDYLKIESSPHKVLETYSDKEHCAKKLQQTLKTPYRFGEKKFDSIDEIQEWISDFSQGDGDDGEKLYEQCDKSCSPRYEYDIVRDKKTYLLTPIVVCGHARDKDDNTYKILVSCNKG